MNKGDFLRKIKKDKGVGLITLIILAMILLILAVILVTFNMTFDTKNKTIENNGTLAQITLDNYGDYIDLGKNLVGESTTEDDWRILYNDTENGKIYAILADYLPNSTGIASKAGLGTEGVYSVYAKQSFWKNGNNDILLKSFKNSVWKENLIDSSLQRNDNIDVKGAVEAEILIASYNERYNEKLDYKEYLERMYDYDKDLLYLPHSGFFEECEGYYLASKFDYYEDWEDMEEFEEDNLRSIIYHQGDNAWKYAFSYINLKRTGLRPVAIISSDIEVISTKLGDKTIWRIVQ